MFLILNFELKFNLFDFVLQNVAELSRKLASAREKRNNDAKKRSLKQVFFAGIFRDFVELNCGKFQIIAGGK